MPFEVGEDAFHKARSEKIEKYSDLVDWARTQYRRVNFGIVVVGSLGSWDVANYETMKMLRVSKKYSSETVYSGCNQRFVKYLEKSL